ncbi:MAG: hydrogenase maturation nickel metallochaperone HypA [Nitrospirae bacterium]|nr:hydrogenase maturation nickel metallochaperone HypA [Nitrospirota bacterium]
MHEVSVAQGLLDIVIENCKKGGYKGVESIKIKVGRASGVVPDSLLFAFDAMKHGTVAENASLTIDEVPVSGFCESCKSYFTVEEAYILSCPLCGDRIFRVETGRELNIYEMDVF